MIFVQIVKKQGHSMKAYWRRPNVQCKLCKLFGHVERVYKEKNERQEAKHVQEPYITNIEYEYTLMATYNLTTSSKDS